MVIDKHIQEIILNCSGHATKSSLYSSSKHLAYDNDTAIFKLKCTRIRGLRRLDGSTDCFDKKLSFLLVEWIEVEVHSTRHINTNEVESKSRLVYYFALHIKNNQNDLHKWIILLLIKIKQGGISNVLTLCSHSLHKIQVLIHGCSFVELESWSIICWCLQNFRAINKTLLDVRRSRYRIDQIA